MHWRTWGGYAIWQHASGISVRENRWYRWLSFGGTAIQSMVSKRHPDKPCMRYIKPLTLAARTNPGPTCLLGLGGGAIVHYLWRFTLPEVVESNPEVISLFHEYFSFRNLPPLTIHQTSAESFIPEHSQAWAHILVDLADADGFPQSCSTEAFFGTCREALQERGVLAINIPDWHRGQAVFEQMQRCFGPETLCIPVPHYANMIVLVSRGDSALTLAEKLGQKSAFKRVVWHARFGWMGLTG